MSRTANQPPSLELSPGGVWEIVVKRPRSTQRISLRTTDHAVAAERFAAWLRSRAAGTCGSSIKSVLKRYELERVSFAVDYVRIVGVLRRLSAAIGDTDIPSDPPSAARAIEAAASRYATKRLADGASMTHVAKELRYLRAAIKWAQATGAINHFPVYIKFATPSVDDGLVKILTPDQLRAVMDIASKTRLRGEQPGRLTRLHRFFMIAYWTGARRRSVERLRWEHVDLTPGAEAIDFRPYYAGTTRKRGARAIIGDTLANFLRRAYSERVNGLVLDRTGDLSKQIRDVFRAAGIPEATAHWLRHTRVTALIAKGLTAEQAAAVVGQSEDVARRVYNHLARDEHRMRILLNS